MPLLESDLREVQSRVMRMFMDTIKTFEMIEENADGIYGDSASVVRAAIKECLDDFVRRPGVAGEVHPETLIYQATRQSLQAAGFYGAQLSVKEAQLTRANATLRESFARGARRFWNKPFKKWVDIINNFLGSLIPAVGLGEAIKELKDCLRDELPDDDKE